MNDKKGIYRSLLEAAHEAARQAISAQLALSSSWATEGSDVYVQISYCKFMLWCRSRASAHVRKAGYGVPMTVAKGRMSAAEPEAEALFGSMAPSGTWSFRTLGGYKASDVPAVAMEHGARAFCEVLREYNLSAHWKERSLSVAS